MRKVSILIPVYGVEQYIERCSRSLFEQTYENMEYVFVNDCSPDYSIAVLERVIRAYPERKEFVKIIEHERNRGLAASRNTGLVHSTGEFVMCVDSDDWLEPGSIELLMKQQLKSDSDIVYGRRLIHDVNGDSLWPEKEYVDSEQMTLQMMQHSWDHFITGRLFRRSLFEDHGLCWQEGLDVAEDRYMMTLLAYFAQSFEYVDNLVYHYERRNIGAMTYSSQGSKVVRNNRQELENVLALERFFKDKEPIYRQECARCVMSQLSINIKAALDFRDRKEYYRALKVLRSRHEVENRRGLFGWIRSRYCWKVLSRIKNSVLQSFK